MTTTRAGMVTLGIFATGLVALGGCASEEATETSGGMLQQSPCEEGDATACGFGKTCNEAKECVPSECHDGSDEYGVGPRWCDPGQSCVFEDDASFTNGVGVCK